jgi:hypothetical protein
LRRARAIGAASALLGLAGCGLIAGLSDHELDTRAQDGGLAEDRTNGDVADLPDAPGFADGSCSNDLRIDPKHCGSCGHDCIGGECKAGACQPALVAETDGGLPLRVAVIKDQIFWIQDPPSDNVFYATPAAGSFKAAHPTYDLVPTGSQLLVAFQDRLTTWPAARLDPSAGTFEDIGKASVVSTATSALAHDGSGKAYALVFDGLSKLEMFASTDGGDPKSVGLSQDLGGGVVAVYAGGGNVLVLRATGGRFEFTTCDGPQCGRLITFSNDQPFGTTAVGKDHLFYWAASKLQRVNLDGGQVTQLRVMPERATSIAIADPFVYVSREGADIIRCLQTGCGSEPTVLFQGTAARALAVGERAIYWAGTKDGKTGVWLLAK